MKTMVHTSPSVLLFLVLTSLALIRQSFAEETQIQNPIGNHPFGFIRRLKGWQKGQDAEELDKLKYYLGRFGYLNHLNDPSEGDPDHEYLERAIQIFQFNYHLNTTGILDDDTVHTMVTPRCGVPDIFNKTSTRMRVSYDKEKRPSTFHSVSHYSYFKDKPLWNSSMRHLTWQFATRFHDPKPIMDIKILRPIVERCFARWAAVTTFTFEEVQANPSIRLAFHSQDHQDPAPFDGPNGVLAHSFSPSFGDLHWDADENWGTVPTEMQFDIESVTCHEIGHLLGLDHSSKRDAIMFPAIRRGIKMRELGEDDIIGIRTLYNLPPLTAKPAKPSSGDL